LSFAWCKLDRIRYQIDKDLIEGAPIGHNRGQVCADIQSSSTPSSRALSATKFRSTFDFGRRRKGLWFDFEFAGAHPGSVENPSTTDSK
jgi:hypothetical protein